MSNRFRLLAIVAALAAGLPLACSGSSSFETTPTPAQPTCSADLASIQAKLFLPACAQSGCHGATSPAAGLDLTSSKVEALLVGAGAGTCDGKTLVVPGQPDASFLYEKLTAATPSCGAHMPLSGEITVEQKACVKDWIAGLESPGGGSGGGSSSSTGSGGDADCETCGTARCVDTKVDPAHCGSCANACSPGSSCANGACMCGNVSISFATAVQPIFTASCAIAGCHKGAMAQKGLDLTAGKAHAGLVNVAAVECTDGRKRVLPGQPSQSYLVDKLMNVDICSGTQMPKLGSIPAAQLTAITGWICEGAPNN